MAKPDDDDPRARRDALRREEGPLAAFFDAARAEPTPLPDALLARILADADAVRPPPPARPARRRPAWPGLAALLRPIAGRGAAAALAGCLAVGFLAGSLGAGTDLAADAIWPDYVSIGAVAEGVDGFFDLSAAEG